MNQKSETSKVFFLVTVIITILTILGKSELLKVFFFVIICYYYSYWVSKLGLAKIRPFLPNFENEKHFFTFRSQKPEKRGVFRVLEFFDPVTACYTISYGLL